MKTLLTLTSSSLLLVACAGQGPYSPAGTVYSGDTIDKELYTISVPPLSVFAEYPANRSHWENYSKNKHPEDLTIKEGYAHTSFAASIVVDKSSKIKTLQDIQSLLSDKYSVKNANPYKTSQPNLLCLQPDPHHEFGFHLHMISCIDRKTNYYYELIISYKTKRPDGASPLKELAAGAELFFKSFTVK